MTTSLIRPATLTFGDKRTDGYALIYLTEPNSWQGEFLRGDAATLETMSSRGGDVELSVEGTETSVVVIVGIGLDAMGEVVAWLKGTGPWPLNIPEARP